MLTSSVFGLPSGALAIALTHYKPNWPKKRIIMCAALPLPVLIWTLSGGIMVDAMTASRAECGIDACGMAAAGGFFGLLLGCVTLVTGFAAATFAYRAFGLDEEDLK